MRTLGSIAVEIGPGELAEATPGVVDVYDALARQFAWADSVVIGAAEDDEVLEGVVVAPG